MSALSSDFRRTPEMLQVLDRRIFGIKIEKYNRKVLEVTFFLWGDESRKERIG
jgi:hypothetical protein